LRTPSAPPPIRCAPHRWLPTRLLLALLSAAFLLTAPAASPPLSRQKAALSVTVLPQVALPATDVAAELAADAKAGNAPPLRFAVPRPVVLTPANCGTWEQVTDGRLWRLRVVSTNATDLNFGLAQFWLPEGATLYVISEAGDYYQGPYTAADNQDDGQLWTAVVPGEAAVLELFVPAQAPQEPLILLTQVGTGYRDFCRRWKDASAPKAEGACNNDVICPVGVPWTNEIRSVAVYTKNGIWTCTGTLIMDVPGDFRPFFLTANHCGLSAANASSVVVYWNYQSATCGTHGPGSLAQNQSGATFRAAKYDVDFALIELARNPDPSFRVFYSGWDRSGTAPSGGVGIHHPDCDVKAISLSSNPLTTVNSCIGTGGVNTHWYVQWTSGVTEPGSSGSGIWNSSSHRLVGTLSGGNSACGGTDLTDCYGKFSLSWASGTTAADRLQNWLDPLNTGATSIAGANPALAPAVLPAGNALLAEGCAPTNGAVDPGETVTLNFSLQNTGTAPTTNLVATLLATKGVVSPSGPQTYGVLPAGGAAVARSFTFTAAGACGGTVPTMLQLQDGANNLGTADFSLPLGRMVATLAENFDDVTAPTLPSGWSSSPAGVWETTTAQRDTLPNSAFAPDAASVTDYQLASPPIPISSASAQLTFRNYYNTESSYDGGVLEISINGAGFTDILTAGGSFVSGGYNGTISTKYSNPLGGRDAWTGNSGGFVTTTANLPAGAVGGSVQLRWRLGSDSSIAATGWYVDTITVNGNYTCCTSAPPGGLSITSQPQNQTLALGAGAVFNVGVAGPPPIGYQWRKEGKPLANGGRISGAQTATLTITNTQLGDMGNYSVFVTNLSGQLLSSNATLLGPYPPVILAQPASQRVVADASALLTVGVAGIGPLMFQWRRDGTNLADGGKVSGAATASLVVSNVQIGECGNYSLVVSNAYGSTISSNALLGLWPLAAWGRNDYNQATILGGLSNMAAAAAGLYHSLALMADGTVRAWGAGRTNLGVIPQVGQAIVPETLSDVVDLAAGYYHSLALQSEGTIVAWGAGTNNTGISPHWGQAMVPAAASNTVALAAGGYHSLALQAEGTVVAWGAGTNNTGVSPHYGQALVPPGLSHVAAVVAGGYHSLALRADETVAAWGAGAVNTGVNPDYGQAMVPAALSNVVMIAAGGYHSLALLADGTLTAWGDNTYGQTNVPTGLTNVASIAAGRYFSLALGSDGSIVAWGNNTYSQTNTPSSLASVVEIAGGGYHNLALENSGQPFVTAQPFSRTVDAGADVRFAALATGIQPLNYQWRHNGADIPGATNAWLDLANVQAARVGSYWVVVANRLGAASSATAVLAINGVVTTPYIDSLTGLPSGAFRLQISGGPGTFAIEAAPQLSGWTQLSRVTAPGAVFQYTDPDTNQAARFYRVRLLP
jgi:alpha-tubulin suppressor-like RCC1 family protein